MREPHPAAGSPPQRDHRGAGTRADEGRDVSTDTLERIAAALPSLVLVVAGDEVGADVADGELGDFLGHAEPAHERARGAAQIVQEKINAARLLKLGDRLAPTPNAVAGPHRGEQERRGGDRCTGDDLVHQGRERHGVLGPGLGVLGPHDDAVGGDVADALELCQLAAAQAGEQGEADEAAEAAGQ